MNSRCESFEDAIWEHARTGSELPAEIRVHIDNCPHCAAQLKEAKQISSAMLACDVIPPAPDVRSAVMAQIAPRQKARRPVWGYAFAGTALASLAVCGFVVFKLSTGPASITSPVLPPVATDKSARIEYETTPAGPVIAKIGPDTSIIRHWAHRFAHIKPAKHPEKMVQIAMLPKGGTFVEHNSLHTKIDVLQPATRSWADISAATESKDKAKELTGNDAIVAAKPDTAEYTTSPDGFSFDSTIRLDKADVAEAKSTVYSESDDDRPVAIAVVNWTSNDAVAESNYSYSYKDIDPVTGRVTECKVRRIGDAVNIDLEAKPGRLPGDKGSVNYENTDV